MQLHLYICVTRLVIFTHVLISVDTSQVLFGGEAMAGKHAAHPMAETTAPIEPVLSEMRDTNDSTLLAMVYPYPNGLTSCAY